MGNDGPVPSFRPQGLEGASGLTHSPQRQRFPESLPISSCPPPQFSQPSPGTDMDLPALGLGIPMKLAYSNVPPGMTSQGARWQGDDRSLPGSAPSPRAATISSENGDGIVPGLGSGETVQRFK